MRFPGQRPRGLPRRAPNLISRSRRRICTWTSCHGEYAPRTLSRTLWAPKFDGQVVGRHCKMARNFVAFMVYSLLSHLRKLWAGGKATPVVHVQKIHSCTSFVNTASRSADNSGERNQSGPTTRWVWKIPKSSCYICKKIWITPGRTDRKCCHLAARHANVKCRVTFVNSGSNDSAIERRKWQLSEVSFCFPGLKRSALNAFYWLCFYDLLNLSNPVNLFFFFF